MQELSLKSGGGRNFGRGRNLSRVRYMTHLLINLITHTDVHINWNAHVIIIVISTHHDQKVFYGILYYWLV